MEKNKSIFKEEAVKQKNVPSLPQNLEEIIPSFQTIFPNTRYFEIDSEIAGNRFSGVIMLSS
jgi:hypothetical protein